MTTTWVLLALCLPRLVWYPAMELPDYYLLAPAPHAIEGSNAHRGVDARDRVAPLPRLTRDGWRAAGLAGGRSLPR